MPCVSPDGKPTTTGITILECLKEGPLNPEEVAGKTGKPLFMVRSGLRELKNAGFVEENDGKYKLSEEGQKMLQ
ncbi:MAG: hypothetical protein ACPLKQ_04240 [Candidatus Bathyarchaeales archaeon]